MRDEWIESISRRLGPPIFTDGDEVRFNCWRSDCGASGTPDTKYHLYVNPKKGRYFCQRCQKGGTLDYISKILGVSAPGQTLLSWDTVIASYLYGTPKVEDDFVPVTMPWPDEYVPMLPGTQAYAYLQSRGITDDMISWHKIGYGLGFLKNRIILPDTDKNGDLEYWVARTYGTHKAKYRNPREKRDTHVFNLGRMEQHGLRESVVICEGPISAIVAGYNAVCTYGKYVTAAQIERLVKFRAREYIIAGDGDGLYAAVSLATRLYKRRLNVKFARFFGVEDPASVGSVEAQKRIADALIWNSTSVMEVLV